MAQSIVSLPLDYFPDPKKGRPIFNGQIFVGDPDTDPQVLANRKDIVARQEDGTEIPISPAEQPVRTSAGGVPEYNGATVQILVEGNYSIKVLDKGGSQEYFWPNVFDGEPVTLDYVNSSAVLHDTLAGATTRTDLFDGSQIRIIERVNSLFYVQVGTGGDGWSVIDAANGFQLVLSETGEVSAAALGVIEDGVTLLSAAVVAAFDYSTKATVVFTPETTTLIDVAIAMKSGSSIVMTGATLKLVPVVGNLGPGHLIGYNGDKSDISNPIPIVDMKWIGGTVDVNNQIGINAFGIEVCELLDMIGVKTANTVHDPATEGGRGFSMHPRSRSVTLDGCVAENCDHGFDTSTKSDNLISVGVTGASSTNPITITVSSHGFINGDSVQAQQFTSDFTAIDMNNYVLTNVTPTSFDLVGSDGTSFAAWISNGVISLSDEGAQRNRNVALINCLAEECKISALTMFQANNSRDLGVGAADLFLEGFRANNCGTQHVGDWGVINSSAMTGVMGDIIVFNDADHPVGDVFRGSFHNCDIRSIVDVHTCNNLFNATPLNGVNGLDSGIASFPESATESCKFSVLFTYDTINNGLINTDSVTGSVRDIYRNQFDIILTNRDNYTSSTPFSGNILVNATNFTNFITLHDLPSGRKTSFTFDEPLTLTDNGQSFGSGLVISGESSPRADLILSVLGTASSGRLQVVKDSALQGYMDLAADERWRVFSDGSVNMQITPNIWLPGADNTSDIGSGGLRIKTIHLVNAPSVTSDETLKTLLVSVNDLALDAWESVQWSEFKYLESIEAKGEESARIHVGIGAQTVIKSFSDVGLDAFAYALIRTVNWPSEDAIYDDDENISSPAVKGGERYEVVYEEALAMECALNRRDRERLNARLNAAGI